MHQWETNRWFLLLIIILVAWLFETYFGVFGGLR